MSLGLLFIASLDHMDTFETRAKKVSFFVGDGTTSHMAKAEVTEMDGGCIVLSQGGAVNHAMMAVEKGSHDALMAWFYFLFKVLYN